MINLPVLDQLKLKIFPSILRRLLRIDIFNIVKYKKIKILILKKKILIFKNNKLAIKINIDRGSRPLKDGIDIIDNKLYFGDYWPNPNRKPVYLYEIDLNSFKKKIFFTFDRIRHIHCVKKDNYEKNCLYICTGDEDYECGIYRLNINTKEIKALAQGAQKYRAVSLIQSRHKIFYGSDNPNGKNYIYVFDKVKKNCTALKKIEGPAYYSTKDKYGNMYIATTIENRKKHRAIIYRSKDDGKSWQEFREFKKDKLNSKYFGYGLVEFLNNQDEKLKYKLLALEEIS